MSEQSWHWVWQPDQGMGTEQFKLRSSSVGYEARGRVVATLEGVPLNASYLVETDTAWRTRRVRVRVKGGGLLEIISGGEGDWGAADGESLPELDGCIDPDISITPFTNTLPIRRLNCEVGQSVEIKVAYILVPDLALRAAPQRYTRLADRVWRFHGLDIGFTADLTVDEGGFVVDYPGLFRRSG